MKKIKNILISISSLSILVSSSIFNQRNLEKNIHNKKSQEIAIDNFINECETTSYYPISNTNEKSTSTTKITTNQLTKNKEEQIESYKNLSISSFESDGWRGSNLIGRHMNINITKIIKVTGIYSHFSSYFDHDILESGSANSAFSSNSTYTDTNNLSYAFNFSVNYYVEAKLEAKANIDVVSTSASLNQKYGASYVYSCTNTRNSTVTQYWSTNFTISEKTADYCLEGYSLSIGKQGVYYYFVGNYQEISEWWWGNYATQGTSTQYFVCVLANPSDFDYCFAYKLKSDTESDYYKQ